MVLEHSLNPFCKLRCTHSVIYQGKRAVKNQNVIVHICFRREQKRLTGGKVGSLMARSGESARRVTRRMLGDATRRKCVSLALAGVRFVCY